MDRFTALDCIWWWWRWSQLTAIRPKIVRLASRERGAGTSGNGPRRSNITKHYHLVTSTLILDALCSAAVCKYAGWSSHQLVSFPTLTILSTAWNNGKEVPRLDLTSSTTPGQQIHYGLPHPDSKYNKSMWLADVSPCHAPIGRLSPLPCLITQQLHVCYISQLLRDSFSVSQQPPIWEPPSHYSMIQCTGAVMAGGHSSQPSSRGKPRRNLCLLSPASYKTQGYLPWTMNDERCVFIAAD